MSPSTATAVFGSIILALFLFDRDRKSRVSLALWIPVAWLSISASRMVSQWLGVAPADSPEQYLEGSPLDAQIFAGLLVAGLVVLFARGARARTFLSKNKPVLVFLLYCAASILWSDFPFVAFKRWTKAVGDLIMILVVLTDPDPIAALKRLLARCGFVLIPLSLLLIRYYPELGRAYNPWDGTPYNIGVATGKNGLGYVCLLFGLGSLWRILLLFRGAQSPRKSGTLIAHGVVLLMALWLFWMADSATSLVCFLVGGGLIAVTTSSGLVRKPAAVNLLVGALLFVAVYGLFLNPGGGLVEAIGRDATLTGRTELWSYLVPMIVNPLFGTGFESFWLGERLEKLYRLYWFHPTQSHNGYFEVFLNLGWTGLFLLGLVMVWGYRDIVGGLRRDPQTNGLRLAYFVVAAIYNLTEHAFRELHPVWIAFLLAVTAVPEAPHRTDR